MIMIRHSLIILLVSNEMKIYGSRLGKNLVLHVLLGEGFALHWICIGESVEVTDDENCGLQME